MRNARGVTLMELIVAMSVFSVVFIGVTAMYVSGYKSFKSLGTKENEIAALVALEHMTRRIGLGNNAEISDGGAQIKVRWDYAEYPSPLNTPGDYADDTYIKYRFIDGRLRYRIDATSGADVSASDREVEPGLVVGTSSFTLLNPHRVEINFTAQVGSPAVAKNYRSAAGLQERSFR